MSRWAALALWALLAVGIIVIGVMTWHPWAPWYGVGTVR